MTEQNMIVVYRDFTKGKSEAEMDAIRHEMMVSHDKGSMVHFTDYLLRKYGTPKLDARKIYKCLYYETWIGELDND